MKKFSILIFALLIISMEGKSQSIDTLEWTMLIGGNKAGFLKKWKNKDGSFTQWLQYNDRGRGDSTVTNYRYDKDGYLEFVDAIGVDYYKKPVFEKFKIENGVAYWENNSEKGQKELDQKADYEPVNMPFRTSFKNYFQSVEKTIQLLPTGSSKLKVLKEYKLINGKKVRLVSTVGAGLTPNYFWIDEGEEFFALIFGNWFAYFRKDFEYLNKELLKIQNEYEDKYFEEIAKNLTIPIDIGLIISNANIFNSKTGDVHPNGNILIENGKIKDIIFGKFKTPKGYQSIDATGKFVMPGLWDMHVHFVDPSDGLLHLSCGITNVRDMGNSFDLIEKKNKIDSGIILGPRIQIMSGFIDGAGEFAGPMGEKINTIEEGKLAVKKYADLGYQQIKLYSSIKPEWVAPISKEAKKYNMLVCGHIPAHMLATDAIESGFDEINHVNMLFLNFYGKELDTRTPVRFTAVAKNAASFDFESEAFSSFVRKLKKLNIAIDPTVSIFEDMFTGEAGEPTPSYKDIIHRLPLDKQRFFKSGSSALETPEGLEETYKNSFTNILKMVKILYENGITIVPGTDDFAGFTLHRELENYVRAGIPNKEVLKMATLISATVAGKSTEYGNIDKGKIADLIIVNGNPIENIEDIRKIEVIIKDNNVYKSKEILKSLSIKYFE